MKKKQTIAIILASAMMFSLIGCSSPSKVIEGSEGMKHIRMNLMMVLRLSRMNLTTAL